MQISAHSLLASQQQAAKPQKPASQPAAFAPLDFKQAEKPAEAQAAQMPPPTGPVRPGTHLDIKV